MQVATSYQYAEAGRKAKNEGFRSGSREWWARIRELLNEQHIITHAQLQAGEFEDDESVIVLDHR